MGGSSSSFHRGSSVRRTRACASASARRRKKRFIKVTGLPLDVTEEKLKVLVERLQQQKSQASQGQVEVEVELDKNLLGVCESGDALVKLVWEEEGEEEGNGPRQ